VVQKREVEEACASQRRRQKERHIRASGRMEEAKRRCFIHTMLLRLRLNIPPAVTAC